MSLIPWSNSCSFVWKRPDNQTLFLPFKLWDPTNQEFPCVFKGVGPPAMEISREGVQQTLFINTEFTLGLDESPSEEWFQEVDPWAGR